ncbi:phosphate acetyltransferase [Legionella sp. CNM-4043-24]|uniref:phosphate acetyltransferase n=1 Tax=Legionella sp. CNM-4043-24 TaxID=3421646 RepID=UPI00403A8BDA
MSKRIYLTGIEKKPGKSFVSLGVASFLKEQFANMTCHKLFSESDNDQITLLEDITQNKIKPVMPVNQAIAMMRDQPDDLFAKVLSRTKPKADCDLVYFEGTDFESDNDVFEYDFNLTLASQLSCDVLLVVSAKDRTLQHTLSVVNTALDVGKKNHARVIGVIINRVKIHDVSEAQALFNRQLKSTACLILPEFDDLANPSMKDIAIKLNARILCGENEAQRTVNQITIAAKTVGNFLESRRDRKGMLIITPDDRLDILLGSLLADQSSTYPKIAGMVLTGDEGPGPVIMEIITGLDHPFPVLHTSRKTYETATTLFSAKYSLSTADLPKVKMALTIMEPYLTAPLLQLMQQKQQSSQSSPAIFLYELNSKAQKANRHIVLPEGDDPRILAAADYLLKRNIVTITLLGNPDKIHQLAKRQQLELPGVRIINIYKSTEKERYATLYAQLRQHKNVNYPIALERMTDANYYAAMMVYCNDADGMVSGAAHTTADTVRPALEIIKTKPGVSRVSSIFIMCMPTRVLIYGDCAINTEPDSETLAEIATQAADIAKRLGLAPRVALLSYSSGGSGKGDSVDKVSRAMTLLSSSQPDLLAEGPIQYDAAVDPDVAKKKLPDSRLAGNANVLIFPDLNTGNNTYKAVQRETGALAIGPVLLGLNKPVNDLSRGCTAQDIINTILVTAIQAGDLSC